MCLDDDDGDDDVMDGWRGSDGLWCFLAYMCMCIHTYAHSGMLPRLNEHTAHCDPHV